MISVKPGVKFTAEQATALILIVVEGAYNGYPCTITSGIDGKHSEQSLHYRGRAFDFRTKFLPEAMKDRILEDLKRRLTSDFDILLEARGEENEHLHIEWDPKDLRTGEA